ncbi:BQ2448_7479 [Microbotryum intermedium]|uniref:BQ2448_7479 protein n=1 Tax=Microbotryum intermedium TaxID=269621 RepID=A0A238FNH6_9BASI|nr:BQ2448_7479 [Microbotryum intermedium]
MSREGNVCTLASHHCMCVNATLTLPTCIQTSCTLEDQTTSWNNLEGFCLQKFGTPYARFLSGGDMPLPNPITVSPPTTNPPNGPPTSLPNSPTPKPSPPSTTQNNGTTKVPVITTNTTTTTPSVTPPLSTPKQQPQRQPPTSPTDQSSPTNGGAGTRASAHPPPDSSSASGPMDIDSTKKHSHIGAIVGATLGGFVFLLLAGVFWYMRRVQHLNKHKNATGIDWDGHQPDAGMNVTARTFFAATSPASNSLSYYDYCPQPQMIQMQRDTWEQRREWPTNDPGPGWERRAEFPEPTVVEHLEATVANDHAAAGFGAFAPREPEGPVTQNRSWSGRPFNFVSQPMKMTPEECGHLAAAGAHVTAQGPAPLSGVSSFKTWPTVSSTYSTGDEPFGDQPSNKPHPSQWFGSSNEYQSQPVMGGRRPSSWPLESDDESADNRDSPLGHHKLRMMVANPDA